MKTFSTVSRRRWLWRETCCGCYAVIIDTRRPECAIIRAANSSHMLAGLTELEADLATPYAVYLIRIETEECLDCWARN